MPYVARKRRKRWAIVNVRTGKVVGHSTSKRKATIGASIRNPAHR